MAFLNSRMWTLVFAAAVLLVNRQTLADSISVRVSDGNDDAEEHTTDFDGAINRMDLGSSDLELGEEGGAGDFQEIGIRFAGVALPPAIIVDINSAAIQFAVDEATSTPTSIRIFGELAPNPISYSNTVGDITSRTKTTAFVDWSNIPEWTDADATANLAGPNQRTPDLAAIIEEIISQPGWANGNAMAFVIVPNPGGERIAESFNGAAAAAPLLEIDFDLDSDLVFGDANGDLAVDILDFNIIRDNFLAGGTLEEGDINLSGRTDFQDFRDWKNVAFPVVGGAAAVPEPATLSLCAFSLLMLGGLARRRRTER